MTIVVSVAVIATANKKNIVKHTIESVTMFVFTIIDTAMILIMIAEIRVYGINHENCR
jgi:hypothetical protein